MDNLRVQELIGDEIVDETDRWLSNEQRQRADPAALKESLPANLRTLLELGVFLPGYSGGDGDGEKPERASSLPSGHALPSLCAPAALLPAAGMDSCWSWCAQSCSLNAVAA